MRRGCLVNILIVIIAGAIITTALAFVADKLGIMSTQEFRQNIENSLADVFGSGDDEASSEADVDQTPLEVTINTSKREILEGQTAITVKTNKEVSIEESDRYKLFFVEEKDGIFYYALEMNNIAIGDSLMKVVLKDEAQNEFLVEVPIDRQSYPLPQGAQHIEDWEDSVYVVDGDDLLAQIDKKHKMIDDYNPPKLLNISTDLLLYANTADLEIREDAGLQLKQMALDLQSQTGKTITILSGHRSHNTQVETYSRNVRSYGQEEADKFSARPGFSEHHLGTVVDFYSPDTGDEIFSDNFDNTVAGKWLMENAHKYGFIQTYPKGSEEKTGYKYEPWQYRYIGTENAQAVKDSGLMFVEWLNQDNNEE